MRTHMSIIVQMMEHSTLSIWEAFRAQRVPMYSRCPIMGLRLHRY